MVSGNFKKFVLFVLALAFSVSVSGSERVALIIANDDYQDAIDVQGAESGVAELERVLKDRFGFDVNTEIGSNRYYTQLAMSEFRSAAERADIALLYYVGHSIVLSGRPYLVPTDASLRGRADLRKLIDINTLARPLGAGQNLVVVIDGCWEELLAEGWGDRFGRQRLCEASNSINLLDKVGRLVVFSDTTPDAVSARRSRRQPYAAQLANVLGGSGDGELLEAILKRVNRLMSGDDSEIFGSLSNNVTLGPVSNKAIQDAVVVDEAPSVNNDVQLADNATVLDQAGFYVDSQPANAQIQILNIQPRYFPGIQLEVGNTYQIRVQADGYSPLTRWMRFLPDGDEMRIQIELEALSPEQVVDANDSGDSERSGRGVAHSVERDFTVTDAGYRFEADITGGPRAVRLFYRFGGVKYEKLEMPVFEGKYIARLDVSAAPAQGTLEYFVFAEYAQGDNQSAGSANSPLTVDISRQDRSQTSQPTTSEAEAATNETAIRSAVAGSISFEDMQLVVARFNALKDSIEAKDGRTLERLAADSEARDVLRSMANDFQTFDLELVNVRSSENQGTISADLKINSYRRTDGSMVVPSPRNNSVSLTSSRLSSSGSPEDRWSSLVVAR
jgi:hypothetical protein